MNRRPGRSGSLSRVGFTLIEVLVATAIMTVLIGSLYAVFRGVLKLRQKTFEAVEAELPKSFITTIMKRDIVDMAAPVGILAGPVLGEKDETKGSRDDRLEFFTSSGVVNKDDPWGDVQKVAYYLVEPETSDDSKGYDLVRAVTRNLLAAVVEEPEEQRLLSGVRSLEFAYFDGQYWQDSWDSTTVQNKPPSAVKVQIDFVPPEPGERENPPVELMCEIAAEPRSG
jgi:type II secretion system protein J